MRDRHNIFDLAELLTDPPSGGPIQMWIVGAGLAVLVSGYGIVCCWTRHATTLNLRMRNFAALSRGLFVTINGSHAVTFGLVLVFIGLFIHFQWFWGNHKRLVYYYEIPKYFAVAGLAVSAIGHFYTFLTHT